MSRKYITISIFPNLKQASIDQDVLNKRKFYSKYQVNHAAHLGYQPIGTYDKYEVHPKVQRAKQSKRPHFTIETHLADLTAPELNHHDSFCLL